MKSGTLIGRPPPLSARPLVASSVSGGASRRSFGPGRQRVLFAGIPYNDPISGRPLLELYPMSYSDAVDVALSR